MPHTLYLLALAVFVMGTSEFMLAGLLPAISAELDVTLGAAGLLTSALAVGMIVGAPAMAAFARRWPPRLTLILCLLVFAVAHVIGAITPSFDVLLLTRVVSAVANAGFLAVALTTATALVPSDRKGRALSILLSGTTVATVAGVPAGALLGTAMGWRATFWAIAALGVLALLGLARGISHDRSDAGHTGTASPPLGAELRILATPRLLLTMVVGALINGGTFAAFTFLAPVVTGVAGLGEAWVSGALVLFGAGSFLGVTVAGRLSDRRPGVVLAVGGPLLLASWIVASAVASHPVALLASVFVQGVLSFGVGSTVIARVLYAASGAPTMGGSYATAALNTGAALGPVLGALALADGAGPLAPFSVAAALTASALLLLLVFRRTLAPTA
ncbi:Cmx/CmrA family chloramphenicol efflux MFS transporter [Microbacterium algeriense]|uniref:MFS transporter n=1 Tax=Microbacterium algeriense TaxID=2615184 RepID=A0ABQ6VAU0_9MICO|nr:Cmx/CmrA family chloramphenicol efflux MFS transporter [Microbacterium algeriense]KAB1867490.1 MFS transporter [Microbacterium algeriense]